jgi:hypothetical protein
LGEKISKKEVYVYNESIQIKCLVMIGEERTKIKLIKIMLHVTSCGMSLTIAHNSYFDCLNNLFVFTDQLLIINWEELKW